MMTMNKSSRWKTLRALAVVPVIALALLAFANPKSVAAVVVTADVQQDRMTQSTEDKPELVIVGMRPDNIAEVEASPQADEETKPQSKKVYESVEQMPEFPGGIAAMMRYLSENIKYPPEAAKNNIEGRVVLQFVIDETGQVGDIQVARPVSEELDAEAVRVVKSMPKFEPGRIKGEPVAVWYTLPVAFKLQSKPQQAGE